MAQEESLRSLQNGKGPYSGEHELTHFINIFPLYFHILCEQIEILAPQERSGGTKILGIIPLGTMDVFTNLSPSERCQDSILL